MSLRLFLLKPTQFECLTDHPHQRKNEGKKISNLTYFFQSSRQFGNKLNLKTINLIQLIID